MSTLKHASENEMRIGIEIFYTATPGIKGKLRKSPDDFIVDEIPLPLKTLEPQENLVAEPQSKYVVARVRVVNWETNSLVRELSKQLGIPRQHIYFAGTKDKRAVTTQTMVFKTAPENILNIALQGVEVSEIGTRNNPIKLGDLLGNKFKINVRELKLSTEEVERTLEETAEQLMKLNGFPNFFGVQRFGAVRPNTHKVGECLVRNDFEGAAFAYLGNPEIGESEDVYNARAFIDKTHDFEEAIEIFPKFLGFERTIIQYLIKHPNNYAGAFKRLPKNLQFMFIHAYQSYLFNRILSRRLRRQLPLNEPQLGDFVLTVDRHGLPDHNNWLMVTYRNQAKLTQRVTEGQAFVSGVLFGAESEFAAHEPGEIEREVIEAEGLTPNDFIIPELPRLSSKGLRREMLAPLRNFSYQYHRAGSGQDENMVELNFELLKGCYATSVLREFMKAEDLRNY